MYTGLSKTEAGVREMSNCFVPSLSFILHTKQQHYTTWGEAKAQRNMTSGSGTESAESEDGAGILRKGTLGLTLSIR